MDTEAPHPYVKNRRFRGRGVFYSQEPTSSWAQRQQTQGCWASSSPAARLPNPRAPRRRFPGHRARFSLGTEGAHSWGMSQCFSRRRNNYCPGAGPSPPRAPSRYFPRGYTPVYSRSSLPTRSRFATWCRDGYCFQLEPQLRRTMSGPAVTLYVEYIPGEVFSVDLVPVFVLDPSQWPGLPVRQPVITDSKYAEQWCVVPKPNNHIDQYGNPGTFWRMSFYNQEKEILNDKKHLKNALKLMKLLRDKEGWQKLSSYYLKTVYLWRVIETDSHYWNNGIGVLFMNMLRTLRDYLKDRQSIPFFWDSGLNVLSTVDRDEIRKIGFRLDRIIRDIDRHLNNGNPTYIEDLFLRNDRSHNSPTVESPTEAMQQARGIGWEQVALGVAALAAGGAFLLFRNNRDQ